MTLRQRITDYLLGDEKRKLERTARALWEAYQDGPYATQPGDLVRQLAEYDSAVLEDLVQQLQWERLSMLGYDRDTDAERQRVVKDSRRLWRHSPLAQWGVWCWTNYGVGDAVSIACVDDRATDVVTHTWSTSQIFADDRIHELSNLVLVDGNVFFVAYEDTLTGSVRFSVLPQDEMVEIVTDPNDYSRPLLYKRQWTNARNNMAYTMYYPDWRVVDDRVALDSVALSHGARRSDVAGDMTGDLGDGRPATIAYILHAAHNRKDVMSLWGWPILGISASFIRAHKSFIENRLTVAAQKASFVREFTTGGGSRAVDAIKANLASTLSSTNYIDANPPSVGGNLVHNKAVEHRDLPMSTGAGDAKADNEMFAWMPLLGMGLLPTSAGLDTSRWATALTMDKTQAMQWARYQTFWSAQFQRIVEIVLKAQERRTGIKFDTYECDVSIDSLNQVYFPEIVSSLSQLVSTALTPLVDNGTIPSNTARGILASLWRMALQALGTGNAAELTSDEAFEIGTPGATAGEAVRQAYSALRSGRITESEFVQYLLSEINSG